MNNILDNKLVRKYFYPSDCSTFQAAYNVLIALQQPIRKGERYLTTHDNGGTWKEQTITGAPADEPFHPYLLRLPDAFQKQEKKECHHRIWKHRCLGCDEIIEIEKPTPSPEKCECVFLNESVCPNPRCPVHKPKDAVEEKINEFRKYFEVHGHTDPKLCIDGGIVELMCRNLVRLARETK